MSKENRSWFAVQNGRQVDIHEVIPDERREITIVADVRERDAQIIAKAPQALRLLREARDLIIREGESLDVSIQFPQHGWLREVNNLLGDNVQQEGSAS